MRTLLILLIALTPFVSCRRSAIMNTTQNDKIRSEGRHGFDSYTFCSFTGHKTRTHKYKIGKWVYWYANGQKMAEGTYIAKKKKKKTNCKGGARVHYGAYGRDWKCWDENGNEIKLKTLLEQGVLTKEKQFP